MSEKNSANNDNKQEETKLVFVPTSKQLFNRAMNEESKVADVARDIEMESVNPGECNLELNERGALLMQGLKTTVNWSLGAKFGLGTFSWLLVGNMAWTRVFKGKHFTPGGLAFDVGFLGIITAYVAFAQASPASVTELPLRPGYPTKTTDEYCLIIMRHFNKAVREEGGALIADPITTNGRILTRAFETCLMRQTYEHALRRENGLSNTDPVPIPEPGVPGDILTTKEDDADAVMKSVMEDPKYLSLWADQHAMDQEEHAAKVVADDGEARH